MIREHSCECEHVSHFPNQASELFGHHYGCEFKSKWLEKIKTTFGIFKLCPNCRRNCAQYDWIIPEEE